MRERHGIKERLKIALKHVATGAGPADASSRILTYHSVGDRDHPMNVTCATFHDQMAWLSDSRPCITVQDALDSMAGIAITFDDGYRDNLINAQPILEKFGIPWTLFFVAGRAANKLGHDLDAATSTLLSWDEIRSLHAQGVQIGGHTMTHARLSGLGVDEQRREIDDCFRTIEAELGEPPSGFAYPYGSALDYSPETVAIVKESGFKYALSNRYGPLEPSDRWTARRIWIDRTDTLEFFKRKVEGRLDRLRMLDSAVGIRARQLVNRRWSESRVCR